MTGADTGLREPTPGRLVRSITTLVTGTVVAQALTLAATPILSRLFGPTDFGVLGLVNSFAMLFVGAAALRYDMAVVLPEHDDDAANLVLLSLGIVVATVLVQVIAVALARDAIAEIFDAAPLARWLWVAPVIVLTTASYNVLTFWCTRRKQFSRLSISAVIASGASVAGKTGAGFAGLSAVGLVMGQVLGQLVATAALSFQVAREDLAAIRGAASWARARALARKHSDFPRYQAPMTLVNTAAQQLPVYFLGAYFGATNVGFWSLTVTLVSTPVFVVTNAVRQVLYQRAGELSASGAPIAPMLRRSTWGLLALGIIPTAAAAWFGPSAFAALLGAEWAGAGEFARYVVVWQLSVLVSAPAVAAFPALGAQRMVFVWQLAGGALSAGALVAGGAMGEPLRAVQLYSLAMTCLNLALVALVLGRARRGQS